ncbi:MAG: Fe-S cluster assembly protein SufD [Balneolaceae bacterium]
MGKVEIRDSVLHQLASNYKPIVGNGFPEFRKESLRELEETPFPNPKDEAWRFIDLRPLNREPFLPVNESDPAEAGDVEKYFIPESESTRLVFVNGLFQKSLSSIEGLPDGVVIGNLADHAGHSAVVKHLGRLINYEKDPFTLLNNLSFEDGSFVYLPEDSAVESPIQLLQIYTDASEDYFTAPRVLVVAEPNSRATLIEDHIGLAENRYLTIPVSEFRLYEGAHLHHVRIQRDSLSAFHFSRPIAWLSRHAEYHAYTITLGGQMTRNEPRVIQDDEEVDFTLDGLVLIDGNQVSDTHSVMDHKYSHANSHQLHKVVVKGHAHSIFNGKIFVRKDAQKIDSFQENRNLLLSVEGLVHTKPQLEIFADDVLCSHGATIGQLDPEEVFYLQSRGMTAEKAKEVLTYAFALETIENVTVESVHDLLLDEVKRYTKGISIERMTA